MNDTISPSSSPVTATIPKHHTAETLLGTLAWLRADPANRQVRVRDWLGQTYNLAGFEAWFMDRLNEKINRNIPRRGRKDCYDWFMAAWRTARDVNTPRLVVHSGAVPLEFRARLAERISDECF